MDDQGPRFSFFDDRGTRLHGSFAVLPAAASLSDFLSVLKQELRALDYRLVKTSNLQIVFYIPDKNYYSFWRGNTSASLPANVAHWFAYQGNLKKISADA